MAKKKKHHEEHEEHMDETWLIPYADLLTLLLALFIVLFSMSKINEGKSAAMFQSLFNAFNTISVFNTDTGGQKNTNTSYPANAPDSQPVAAAQKNQKEDEQLNAAEEKKLQDLMKKLQTYIDNSKLNAVISLTDLREGIQITLKDVIVFDSGSDRLKQTFIPTLQDIVGMINTVDNPIVIEGHTDNQPIHNSQFASNWELSGARAMSVLHYIQNQGVDPTRLRFEGYGEFKPLFPNDSAEHRESNRRVNIIILRK
ncbi:MAG TPA: OmpA family protein [Bacillota bacterium]|nr:OmpA family protein [Bacillota bacterium]